MSREDQKKDILKASLELLRGTDCPEKITSRQIAAQAGVNVAMINYYYGSKDNLISQAVAGILEEASAVFVSPPNPEAPPKERLRQILRNICLVVLKYRRYTKIYVPHLLLSDEITLPQYILPEIREYFKARRNEKECRIIAYQIISFMQLAFYRSDDFLRYAGIDLSEEQACCRLVDWELDVFLTGGEESTVRLPSIIEKGFSEYDKPD